MNWSNNINAEVTNMSESGLSILQGAKEALEFAKGKDNASVVHLPDGIDVATIRAKFKMTQDEFSKMFGLKKRTLQEWEQGRRTPTGASKVLLQVLLKEPDAVIRALQQ